MEVVRNAFSSTEFINRLDEPLCFILDESQIKGIATVAQAGSFKRTLAERVCRLVLTDAASNQLVESLGMIGLWGSTF